MRVAPETTTEKWMRLWHLRGRPWLRQNTVPLAATAILFALIVGTKFLVREAVHGVEELPIWLGLAPWKQYVISGSVLEISGWLLLSTRWKRRATPATYYAIRAFVGEIAMIVLGLVLLFKAALSV